MGFAHALKHEGIIGCAFFPTSNLVSTVSDHTIIVWDGQTGSVVSTISPSGYCRNSGWCVLAHSHNKSTVIKLHHGTIRTWDPYTGTCGFALHNVRPDLACCALSPDDTHIAIGASLANTLEIWNVRTGARVRTIQCAWTCCCCCYSSDGLLLACDSSPNTVRVWDPHTGVRIRTLRGHTGRINSCVFSPRDVALVATSSGDNTIKLWDARKGVCLDTLVIENPAYSRIKCRFSRDGVYLATYASLQTKMWNVHTGICVHSICHNQTVTCWDFSSDGASLVTSCADAAHCWRLPSVMRNNVGLLFVILHSIRNHGLWLPTELWDWMYTQWFCYQ